MPSSVLAQSRPPPCLRSQGRPEEPESVCRDLTDIPVNTIETVKFPGYGSTSRAGTSERKKLRKKAKTLVILSEAKDRCTSSKVRRSFAVNDAAQDDNAVIDNASVANASICQRIDDQPSVITVDGDHPCALLVS